MKRKKFNLEEIYTYNNIYWAYKNICKHCRSNSKKTKFTFFLYSNIKEILDSLLDKSFEFDKYTIFIIKDPKYRIIMSDTIKDKIINYLIAYKVLLPSLTPSLIEQNVATRKGYGAKKGYYFLEKYINILKNSGNVYALKVDIKKYFYNIDHKLLINMISKKIKNIEIINLIKNILSQTNEEYINYNINKLKVGIINNLNDNNLIKQINELPTYNKNKGLSIGNVTSQIMAIFYLSSFDHYVKENLKCKYYLRYVDDIIILSNDINFLKNIFVKASNKLKEYKLEVNKKSNIYKVNNSFTFLGRTYYIKNNILHYRARSTTYKKIVKKLDYLRNNNFEKYYLSKISYRGYLGYEIYHLKDEYLFLIKKYKNVIVNFGNKIKHNINEKIIKLITIEDINILNIEKIINYFNDNSFNYIYLEKNKITYKY